MNILYVLSHGYYSEKSPPSQIWLPKIEILMPNLLAWVWHRDNSSHWSSSKWHTEAMEPRSLLKVCRLPPVPSMIFTHESHFFLKRAHQSCHPSHQQLHWALGNDIPTFQLKSCFRRELLKFKWAGHIEEAAVVCMHTSTLGHPFSPESRVWFCFCKWASETEVSLPRPPLLGVIISNVWGWIDFPLNLVSKPDRKAALSHNLKAPTIWLVTGPFFILGLSVSKQRSGRPQWRRPGQPPGCSGLEQKAPCWATTASS